MSHETLPFFFYGTLRPGERNYGQLLQGRTIREEADWCLEGVQLYLHAAGAYSHIRGEGAKYQPSGAYPYMVEGTGRVAGHLVELKPALYETLLLELDWLEGYSETATLAENEYLRVEREVRQANGATARAWVYLATPQAFTRQAKHVTLIESGDWLAWRKLNQNA